MEAGEYGLTRGTCFVARPLEVVAVAGLLWISLCVLGAADFFVFFFRFFFFDCTRLAASSSMRPPCFIYLSTSKDIRGPFAVPACTVNGFESLDCRLNVVRIPHDLL